MFRAIRNVITVCSVSHTKLIIKLCGQNSEGILESKRTDVLHIYIYIYIYIYKVVQL